MTKRHRRFYINIPEAHELFKAYGLIAKQMNFYQIRIKQEESRSMWDWYHTQGTVVVTTNGIPKRWNKQYGNAEDLAMDIIKSVYAHENHKGKSRGVFAR